jgi:uncharacterized damage-inducible protein DinB
MKEQLLQAWQTNNEKNLLLLRSIAEEALSATLAPRSRTVGEQMTHLHNVRLSWTEHVAKNLFQKEQLLPKDAKPTLANISGAFVHSTAIIS